ncbi:nitrilase-related carbon-nitrogen hydrolase [Petroclostridium sp. X23]|uniref:nitrilase-related carbon-nitrogen hydrolase n=1 Tax=Petroclostridium sp. X23 TaxID=3045146 RepID=UPI0024ACA7D6|nr:nitrilase-related carbon-nitrogen hydrolase [Petroclostridium sp. X23]WHH60308.1 nitrilase-related carbon-nitrogen hydrolase [Petroclostridium sp. X23]
MKNLFKYRYNRKLSIDRIENYCQSLKMSKVRYFSDAKQNNNILISCVQRRIKVVKNIEQYINILYYFVKQAAERKSHLVVFPEYNFFDVLGLIPGFSALNSYLNKKPQGTNKAVDHSNENNMDKILMAFFYGTAEPIERCLKRIISILASGFGLYIYSGSYLLAENGKLYNAGSLYGPDGVCIGTQRKVHTTDFEKLIGIERDNVFQAHALPFGKVAFPICMDATYFETFHIIRKMGADMVILPIANMEEYDQWKALRGIWPRVQETYVYGLKASLTGWIAGMHFTGKAGIFAPIMMTPKKDGVIAISQYYEGDELVTSSLNIEKLSAARNEAQYFGDTNRCFEKTIYANRDK